MSKITTHILDTAGGCPAAGVRITLYRLYGRMGEAGGILPSSGELKIGGSVTNKDGRVLDWAEPGGVDAGAGMGSGGEMDVGAGAGMSSEKAPGHVIYKIRFETRDYFDERGVTSFYPWVDIYFETSAEGHYHVPLLISPYGYSTYRGS